MNANELAVMAECACCAYQKEIAAMLRQQQAEIEALKYEKSSGVYDLEKALTDKEITEVIKKIASNNEYVYSFYEDFEGIEFSRVGIFAFARAILRKAQEK